MISKEKLINEISECRELVEQKLGQILPSTDERYATLIEAMRYSLLEGGKRIRAVICMKFCEAAGGDKQDALNAACAIEMLHAYTLIHDDLPCMDNDDMRRGKPSNHIKYGEFTATLAGDAMQALAFDTLLRSKLLPETLVQMAMTFSNAAGPHGVCAGQYLDLSGQGKGLTKTELLENYSLKTSMLISTAAQMGVLAAGGTLIQALAASEYAESIGIAFQARDDILDCISTEDELGKPIGSDAENQKTTLVSLLGLEKCEELVCTETENACHAISRHFVDAEFLKSLAHHLSDRKN